MDTARPEVEESVVSVDRSAVAKSESRELNLMEGQGKKHRGNVRVSKWSTILLEKYLMNLTHSVLVPRSCVGRQEMREADVVSKITLIKTILSLTAWH